MPTALSSLYFPATQDTQSVSEVLVQNAVLVPLSRERAREEGEREGEGERERGREGERARGREGEREREERARMSAWEYIYTYTCMCITHAHTYCNGNQLQSLRDWGARARHLLHAMLGRVVSPTSRTGGAAALALHAQSTKARQGVRSAPACTDNSVE
jgi:hypothetical protein